MTSNDWRQLPLPCEKCAAVSAMPLIVTSKTADVVVVKMRCAQCGHEWSIERATPLGKLRADRVEPDPGNS